MIKVLHFVSTPAIWSGVMSVIMNYYRHIDRSRVQFDFLCFLPCEESYEREINELGGQVFFISKPSASPRTLKELTAFFKKHQGEYQWLHNHEVYLSFLLKPISAHYGIKDFIVHSHATRYSDRKWAAVRNRILCFPIRFMKCHRFACSKAAGAFLFGKRLVEKGNVYILYNAIDTEKFRYNPQKRKEIRELYGIAEDTFLIGHIGRFVTQKNHSYLLEILSLVSQKHKNISLLLVGNGPLFPQIMNMGIELGVHKYIIYAGYHENVADYLDAMDIFVMPSLYEGFPCTCIEAQANGLPCIVSNLITNEICINSNIQRLSIQQSQIKTWVQTILQYENTPRISFENANRSIQIHGFSIIPTSNQLEKFYRRVD